jgi:hypothetical protein
MHSLFDLRQCTNCGQMHILCFRGHDLSPTDSYWFICPNGDRRVEFKDAKLSALECPTDDAIECFPAEDEPPASPHT